MAADNHTFSPAQNFGLGKGTHRISRGVTPPQSNVTTGHILHAAMVNATSPKGGADFGSAAPPESPILGEHTGEGLSGYSSGYGYEKPDQKPEQPPTTDPNWWETEQPVTGQLDYYDRKGLPTVNHPALGNVVRQALPPGGDDGALVGRVMPRGFTPPVGSV